MEFHTRIVFSMLFFIVISTAFKIEPRISRGLTSERGQFPFYVYLEGHSTESLFECGGSLISDRFIATAAHCLELVDEKIDIHLGLLESKKEFEPGRLTITVAPNRIIFHPAFESKSLMNDIALIELVEPIELNSFIQPIELATCEDDDFAERFDVVAVGNGYKKSEGGIADILQYAPMTTTPIPLCMRVFPFLVHRASVFCAENDKKRSSVCTGDSGGPLKRISDNKLIGIASFISPNNCDEGQPQAFTKVAFYRKWISEKTGLNLTSDC